MADGIFDKPEEELDGPVAQEGGTDQEPVEDPSEEDLFPEDEEDELFEESDEVEEEDEEELEEDEEPKPVDIKEELNNLDNTPTAEKNVLGFKNKKRTDEPEKLPEVKPTSKVKVYFSRYKGLRIGIMPSMTKYEYIEGVKRKINVKGHQIKFNMGRYTVQPLPGETDNDYMNRKKVEEDFLDNFMKQHPDRVFKIDPQESKLLDEYRKLKAKHEALLKGETGALLNRGKQGAVGARR